MKIDIEHIEDARGNSRNLKELWIETLHELQDTADKCGNNEILENNMKILMRVRIEYNDGSDYLNSLNFSFKPILPLSNEDKLIREKFAEISRACAEYREKSEPAR